MPRSAICVDAGVVVKLVAFHNDTAVSALWDEWDERGRQVVAPALLLYEVTNVLYQYLRHNLLSSDDVAVALAAVLALPIRYVADVGLHQRALDVAHRFNLVATYDAHYVALAELSDAELWTTDGKLAAACGQDWVRLAG